MKTLKIKNIFIGLISIIVLNSCGEFVTKEDYDNSMIDLQYSEGLKRDSLERIYIATLDEIDGNIDAIRDKYGYLVLGPKSNADFVTPKKDKILNNIAMINTLLADNKKKIDMLEKSLANYKSGKKEFVKSIELAAEKVAIQEKQIEELKTILAEKEYKIEELNKLVSNQNVQIENFSKLAKQQESTINTTYFAYGTYKELKAKHIVKKQGGVLGINKNKVLNEDLNKTEFVEIDKTKTTTIPMMGKKPKLITEHPENSYEILSNSNDLAVLNIKDPENFWKVSKYLVVEVH